MHKTTNTERESLLSAHLDGELSPEERQEAEAAIASDPAAAGELQALAGVRDLIAGLSRPAGPDLAPGVMERLKNQSGAPRRNRATARRLRIGALTGGVAASIACLALFGGRHQPPRPNLPDTPDIATAAPSPAPAAMEIVGPPAPVQTESSEGGALVGPPAELASAGQPAADNPVVEPARSPVPELPGGANPLVFLVADLDGATARDQVAALLALSTHREFHQIELSPPNDGGEAEKSPTKATVVFAATLDPKELTTFRERLATAFPEQLDEGGPAPTLTAELVEKGRVSTLPANPAGDVSFPQTKLAMQFQTGGRRNWPEPPRPDDASNPGREADSPAAAGAGGDAEPPPAITSEPVGGGQPRSILVWVVEAPND